MELTGLSSKSGFDTTLVKCQRMRLNDSHQLFNISLGSIKRTSARSSRTIMFATSDFIRSIKYCKALYSYEYVLSNLSWPTSKKI